MTSNGKISKGRPQKLGKEQEEVKPRENNEESTDLVINELSGQIGLPGFQVK